VGKTAIMNGQTRKTINLPLPGGATAVYDTTFHYRYSDWLGSSRFSSTASRTKFSDDAYAPYGENYAESGTVDPSFTGNDQDTVSGTYDFLFREYNANQGRWISPDPAGLGAVSIANPQTWNRYAYVANNPLNAVDPLGLFSDQNDAVQYLRGLARTAGLFSEFEFTLVDSFGDVVAFDSEGRLPNTSLTFVGSPTAVSTVTGPGIPANNADVPLNPYAQAVFSQPVLQTTAATMTNPCTYVGWTAAAATAGAGGAAVANYAEIEAAVVNNAPTLVNRILNWWFNMTSRPGKPGLVRAAAATAVAAKDAVVTTCKQF
jgi:RHS repeat-associated protein